MKGKICSFNYYVAIFVLLHNYMHANLLTISQFLEITHFWDRSIVNLATLGIITIIYHLLTESEVITGKSETEALCIDRAIARSIPQGQGLRFPCNDRTDEVNKLYIIWPF